MESEPSYPVPDRGPSLIIMMWVLTVVSSITIVMRLVIHARKNIIGWDDLFILLSMVCFYGWTITLTFLCLKGGERHVWDVALLGLNVVTEVELLNWTCQIFGILGIGAGKVSVSALLLAIMRSSHRAWQKTYVWTFCIVLICCISVSCSILTFSQCKPAAALWDSQIQGDCINPSIMANFGIFTGSYNTFVDASLAFIPSTIFWSLRVEFHEKATLSIIFALNILQAALMSLKAAANRSRTCICSALKTTHLARLANHTDLTWETYDIFAWVTAEFFLITVCGTIPTLKPVLVVCLPRREPRTAGGLEEDKDSSQITGLRFDGVSSETRVTTGEKRHSLAEVINTPDRVRVEKSYQVTVRKSMSQPQLGLNENNREA